MKKEYLLQKQMMILQTFLFDGDYMEKEKITGMEVYYYFVFKRKLWYFTHGISMESENEDVNIGRELDETSYNRNDKHIMIDNVINVDFISEHNILHEVKKSKKIEEAGIWQLKYYLYYLKKRGVEGLKGEIDYPLLKRREIVELTEDDELKMNEILEDITQIKGLLLPPSCKIQRFCKSCAYYEFCCI